MLNPSALRNVEFYMGEPKEGVRQGLVSMLRNMGLRNISAFDTAEKLTVALSHRSADVLLIAADLHAEVFPMLKSIRNHEFGRNPFTVISVAIEQDNSNEFDGAMKSGADDVLTQPLAPSSVMDRIERVAFNRLPFIAMPDYIGPDRRKEDQRKMNLPVFEVLNTLKDKIEGRTLTETAIEASVVSQMQDVRTAQLGGYAYKLGFLCKSILKGYETRPPNEDVVKKLEVLKNSLHKAATIAVKGNEPGLASVCTGSAEKIQTMRNHFEEPKESELKLLKTLIRAYQMARADLSGTAKPH